MNPDQIEKLRALAERTEQPSPWHAVPDGDHGRFLVVDDNDTWVADLGIDPNGAAYIAAASPGHIIALLNIIDTKERELEHYRKELARRDLDVAKERAKASAWSAAHVVRSEVP